MVFSELSESAENFFKNEYVVTIVFVLAILYGSLVAPKLPESLMKFVKHPVFLFVALVLVAYITTKNKKVAVIVGLALAITLIFVERTDVNKIHKILNKSNHKEESDELLEKKNNYPKELSVYVEHFKKEEDEDDVEEENNS
jgi:hypothetical protein